MKNRFIGYKARIGLLEESTATVYNPDRGRGC